jgi:hypothetical protein
MDRPQLVRDRRAFNRALARPAGRRPTAHPKEPPGSWGGTPDGLVRVTVRQGAHATRRSVVHTLAHGAIYGRWRRGDFRAIWCGHAADEKRPPVDRIWEVPAAEV